MQVGSPNPWYFRSLVSICFGDFEFGLGKVLEVMLPTPHPNPISLPLH